MVLTNDGCMAHVLSEPLAAVAADLELSSSVRCLFFLQLQLLVVLLKLTVTRLHHQWSAAHEVSTAGLCCDSVLMCVCTKMFTMPGRLTRLLSGKGSGNVSGFGSGFGGTIGTSTETGRGLAVTRRSRLARASSAVSLATSSSLCSWPRASVCSRNG